jgi:hypothetical protein
MAPRLHQRRQLTPRSSVKAHGNIHTDPREGGLRARRRGSITAAKMPSYRRGAWFLIVRVIILRSSRNTPTLAIIAVT